jgi:hypothetical protein
MSRALRSSTRIPRLAGSSDLKRFWRILSRDFSGLLSRPIWELYVIEPKAQRMVDIPPHPIELGARAHMDALLKPH